MSTQLATKRPAYAGPRLARYCGNLSIADRMRIAEEMAARQMLSEQPSEGSGRAQRVDRVAERRHERRRQLLLQIRRIIRANISNPDFALSDIASALPMSERHVQRIFSSCRTSFREQLLECRLSHAKMLLSDSGLTIAEISRRCGYRHPTHFTKRFRTAVGMTPSQWRQTSRQS